jgi:hypothetical protein
MSKQVKRLSLCILYARESDIDDVFDVAKKLWPHHSWLGVAHHQHGLCIMTQNHGKNIRISKAIKDLKPVLPERLHDIHNITSMDNNGVSNTNFVKEAGAYKYRGQHSDGTDVTFVDEGGLKQDYMHTPALSSKKETERWIRQDIFGTILTNVDEHIFSQDHENNSNHVENLTECPICFKNFLESIPQ